jgi:hypothetical protein
MANKKISELTAAGALTGAELIEAVQGGVNVKTTAQDIADLGGGGGTWGSITGTLSTQTDLQAEFNLKSDALITLVPEPGAHTLDAANLTSINAGASIKIVGDDSGALTVPLNATVAFPAGSVIGLTGYTSVVATGGVTVTGTAGDLNIPAGTTVTLEKTGTDAWTLHNGTAAESVAFADITGNATDNSSLSTALSGKQPIDSDLTAIAALSPSNDDIIQRKAGAWTNRSMSQLRTDLQVPKIIQLAASDETTALTTGTKITFRMPYAMTVTAVRASLTTAQTSGSVLTIDIKESGTTIFSTKLTIDNSEKTSTTAATAAVLSDTSLADDAEIAIIVDQVGLSPAGLKIGLIGY